MAVAAIFLAGLTCGLLDITAAFVTWGLKGIRPIRILQGIASGLLGANAFNMGWDSAALGLACHFLIAMSAATIFYLASRELRFLTLRPVLSGVLYGIAVYLVMYWIVMPLSRYQTRPFSLTNTVIAIVTHIICVGLPISLIIHRYSQ
jgi:uncharacterized membrane protein YagU involved in acid resistance